MNILMSRASIWLTAGGVLVFVSLCARRMISYLAGDILNDFTANQNMYHVGRMETLTWFSSLVSLALYGGILLVIVGIVLLVRRQPPPSA